MSKAERRSARAQRSRPIYTAPGSDDDEQQAGSPVEAQYPPVHLRRSKRRISWHADDTDGDSSSDVKSSHQRRLHRSISRRDRVDTSATVSSWVDDRRVKQRRVKVSRVPASSTSAYPRHSSRGSSRLFPSDNIIPPWIDLPSEVLVHIFQYCYEPGNTAWMLDLASRVCRAFAEPALTALYDCPIWHDTGLEKIDRLCGNLNRSEESVSLFNYRAKIHQLHLPQIPRAPRKNEIPDGVFLLTRLLLLAPNVRTLSLTTSDTSNHAASQQLLTEFLFRQLAMRKFLILECHWEAQTFVREVVLTRKSYRQFDSLQRLELEAVSGEMADTPLDRNLLPSLKHLKITFQAAPDPAFDWRLIPRSLLSLDLTGIDQDSVGFLAYLLRPAEVELVDLRLSSALYGDMAFLSSLGQTCPRLEKFHFDLAPFRPEPMRPPLERPMDLAESITPNWPVSLREISLRHFRWADAPGAESLFQSFIGCAEAMINLRSIDIRVHVYNPSWRERKVLRRKWSRRLKRVFLRRTSEPEPHLRSLKAFRMWKAGEVDGKNAPDAGRAKQSMAVSRTARRSSRIAQQESGNDDDYDDDDDDDDDEDEGDNGESRTKDVKLPRQGLCGKVSINIDNQRPRGVEMTEGDFLDSEPSGDEDWNGG